MLVDALATAGCFLAAYLFREASATYAFFEASMAPTPAIHGYLALLPVIAPISVLMLAMAGAYNAPLAMPLPRLVRTVTGGVALTVIHLILLIFALKLHFVSRLVVFVFAMSSVFVLVTVRGVVRWRLTRSSDLRRRILVVGTRELAHRAVSALDGRAATACNVVGCIEVAWSSAVGDVRPTPHASTVGRITGFLKDNVVDEIVLAVPLFMAEAIEQALVAAEMEGVRVRVMANFFRAAPKRLSLDECDAVPFLTLDWVASDDWRLIVKRALDIGVAAGALIVFAPLFALVAIAIRLDSRGPVLFVQRRVGLNKRTFSLVKFRTMGTDAERRQAALETLNEANGPVFKIANDPRVTRVGRFLRRTSIDELPQLWNVLRGDMSLVGPRPLPLRDVSRFNEALQRKRFSVKPGLTCLWQVSGRSGIGFGEWIRLDLWYIDNWSLTLDLKLLAQTVPAVLRGTGAV
jgi:exopolysaccharide biosynthesis polyprenyl glycosylphosphotransferase